MVFIPQSVHQQRVDRLIAALPDAGLDAVFVQGLSSDLQYLLGIDRGAHNQTDDNKYGDAVYGALFSANCAPIVLAPRMGAAPHVTAELAGGPWAGSVRVIGDGILSQLEDPADVVAEVLACAGHPRRVGVIARQWAAGIWMMQRAEPTTILADASALLTRHRMVKDQHEIALMRQAAAVTERSFAAVLSQLSLGMTANEIALAVDRAFQMFGATHPSFHTGIRIAGQGIPERPVAGRKVGDTPIQPGCVITFDIGAVVDGYASDFGRTVFWGEPDARIVEWHSLIMESQAAAIQAMRSGKITAGGLNVVARSVIENAGLGQGFTHRLGHGIGIDVHEEPFLFPGDQTVLETGMCFTIEPSIRVPGVAGVRVEDVVMVTPDGGDPFHTYSHDLLVME